MMIISPRVRIFSVFVLRTITGLALVLIAIQNWNQLAIDWQKFNIGLILLSALLYPISFCLILLVWFHIMQIQVGSFDWRRDSTIYCYSNLVRSLPFGVLWRMGGRVVFYLKENISESSTIAASLWEIVFHVASAIALLLGAIVLRPVAIGTWFWGLALVVASIAVASVVRRIGRQLRSAGVLDIHGVVQTLLNILLRQAKTLGLILILNGITWLNASVMLQLIVYAINPVASFDYLDAVQVWLISGMTGYVVLFLPFLDIGAKEATMTILLSAHMPLAVGLMIALLYRLIFMLSDILWSVIALQVVRWQGDWKSYA